MKRIWIIFTCVMLTACSAHRNTANSSGDLSKTKTKSYKVKVITLGENVITGLLTKVEPQGITVQRRSQQLYISSDKIDVIKFRKKYSVSKGIGIGLVSGAIIGGALGYLAGDEKPDPTCDFWCAPGPTAEEKATGSAILLGFLGGITGGIIGAGYPEKFYIRGNPTNYSNYFKTLQEYAIHQDD